MLAQAHSAPTPVAQSLNFRDRMAWFHKQSATTGSCAEDEVITEGGPQRKTVQYWTRLQWEKERQP